MSKLKELFRLIWTSLWSKTPERCRRMCLLVSLYARLTHSDEDNIESLDKLNQEFKLSRDTNALRFPAMFAPMVWGRIVHISKIDDNRLDQYVTRILKSIPCWIEYGNKEEMQQDIRKLLNLCKREQSFATNFS